MNIRRVFIVLIPYLMSLVCFGVSLTVTLLMNTWLGHPIAFIVFLSAVMLSAWYGGIVSGLLTNIISAIAIYYFFTTPDNSFQMKSILSIVQLIFFIFEGFIISYFIDGGHRYEKIHMYKARDKQQKALIKSLEKRLSVAKQETALRDEFLAIASHELKTPLTTVVLQIQTTLHNIRNVSLSEFSVEHLLRMLQSMQNQTKRLTQMINDLLNISLITTHKMELEKEEMDLATLIADVAESFKEKFEKEGSYISVDIKDSVIGKWDKLRLQQVLDNLISNALKYGNKKPVSIELEKEETTALIHVKDNGIGIKNGDKETIFSLFKRGESDRDYKGLG